MKITECGALYVFAVSINMPKLTQPHGCVVCLILFLFQASLNMSSVCAEAFDVAGPTATAD